jgi:uncharacterized cupin superfamily protein
MPNLHHPDFDEPRDHPGFVARRARLGYQLASERLGVSLWEVGPGQLAYPYHFHLAEEEVLVVLEGTPTLRTGDGLRELEQGEVVAFLTGERGAHQLLNRTDRPIRFLAISNQQPDIVMYPDSDKVAAFERRPDGSGVRAVFRASDAVDYYEGETPPG